MGLTPGHLSIGTSLQATKAVSPSGCTAVTFPYVG